MSYIPNTKKQSAKIHFDVSKVKSIANADDNGGRSYGRQPYSTVENNRYRPGQPISATASIAQSNVSVP